MMIAAWQVLMRHNIYIIWIFHQVFRVKPTTITFSCELLAFSSEPNKPKDASGCYTNRLKKYPEAIYLELATNDTVKMFVTWTLQ